MTLALIRPGPELHIYRDGQVMLEIPLSVSAAFQLGMDLFTEALRAWRDGK